MYLYRFGFYKYWKNAWEEEYYILKLDLEDDTFISRIKKALLKNIDLNNNNRISAKLEYIDLINNCKSIEDLKNINHWYQTNLNFSIKQINLVD